MTFCSTFTEIGICCAASCHVPSTRKVYFPAGQWYDLHADALQEGAQERAIELSPARLPVYVKAGSVIPVQSLARVRPSRT